MVKFAEITLQEIGIDAGKDPWSVKLTGGPDGDVAGNAMRLLLARYPAVEIRLILDGSGALCDPNGADHSELQRILFKGDIDLFDPERLGEGGFILYRSRRKRDGLKEKHLKVQRRGSRLVRRWVTIDEFHRVFDNLIFTVTADLFIPAGGRPETVHSENWEKFLDEDRNPTIRAIVEGANSFITPAAREGLQRNDVVVMRDASANKCGVISSSYEVIANLIMTRQEFERDKEEYVRDVLEILEQRSESEARLIFSRHKAAGGNLLYTQITNEISDEINDLYMRLFDYFVKNPEIAGRLLFRKTLLSHLPRLLRETPGYRRRLTRRLPDKYRYAILATEIASSLVYRSNRETDFLDLVQGHLQRVLAR